MNPESLLPIENLKELRELCAGAPAGHVAEVGVYKGGSAILFYQVAEANEKKTHLFDTFEGMPYKDEIDIIPEGSFADTSVEKVRSIMPNAIFHVGFFPRTAPDDLNEFSFVHIDCDQYQTCKAAIEYFWPRMVSGGVMAWDDYPFPGIKKAIHEKFAVVHFTEYKIPYVRKP